MEFYFHDDLYRYGFAVQRCRLEFPRLHSLNRFFVKAKAYAFDYADVTRAAVGFDNNA
jgi:hypothetical protein